MHYPSGEQWYTVGIIEFHDGNVAKVTNYFGPPFPAAEWRSQWVERMEETPPLAAG